MTAASWNNKQRFKVVHSLRLSISYFRAAASGEKRSEVRKNDRKFRVGDVLQLQEWDEDKEVGEEYTGRFIEVEITYVCTFGCIDGYVSLSIDHRALDAHQTNLFLAKFVYIIETWGE